MEIRGDATTGYAHRAWVQGDWPEYNSDNGETWPACGDIDGDGRNELVLGLGHGSWGWVEIRGDATTGYAHQAWVQGDWQAYNSDNGETRPALCDVDGDGRNELVLGLGRGSWGWVEIRGDATTGYAHRAWVQGDWQAYNSDNGETRPACGDIDGDGRAELVLGLGRGSWGWVEIRGDATTGYAHRAWVQGDWPEYNSDNGETRPALCDVDDDGLDELVLGLGRGSQGRVEIRDDAMAGYAHQAWVQLNWLEYNQDNGATRPACGR